MMPQTAAVDAVLARYGWRADAARLVAEDDASVWRIVAAGAPPLALRVYAADRTDPDGIASELALLQALADDGLMVPRPLADRDGRRLQPWPADPARQAVLLTWVHGRILDAALKPLHLRRVGAFTGRLHRVAEGLVAAGRIPTRRDADLPDLAGWIEGSRPRQGTLGASDRSRLRDVALRLRGAMAALPRDPSAFGLLHGDLHPWNLLFAGGRAGAIDFSDCGFGPHALDLAATLQYLRHPWVGNHDHRRAYPALREALLEGYAGQRALAGGVEAALDICLLARMLNTVEWILDTWPRRDTRPWGPGFLRRARRVFDAALR